MKAGKLDRLIAGVIDRDSCTGCGACSLLDSGITMRLSSNGFIRPVRTDRSDAAPDAASTFRRICPGIQVAANRSSDQLVHPTMGGYVAAWQAWATDPEFRHRGSSGGVLSALAAWLVDTDQAHEVTGVAADSDPRRTVPVSIQSRDEALRAAGSRYAPVAAASNAGCAHGANAAIAKPCEISALRALTKDQHSSPLLLSFFCAGTPSADATIQLLETLGVDSEHVPSDLWYRGRGWPGEFTAHVDGKTVSTSYDDSWGKALGPTTQWRCKVCVDGVGESADVVAADFWHSDTRGYPIFDNNDGISALIARTPRGKAVVEAAVRARILTTEPLDLDRLAGVQPLQVQRRTLLAARLLGSALAGRRPPRYRGFRLIRLAMRHPRESLRTLRGTAARVRKARAQVSGR